MEAVSTIRSATLDDLEALAALEASSRSKPWSKAIFRDELTQNNRIYVVAEEDSVVGFAGVMVVDEEAHVTNLLVEPVETQRFNGRVGYQLKVQLKPETPVGYFKVQMILVTNDRRSTRVHINCGIEK